jgi:hypothetical protein
MKAKIQSTLGLHHRYRHFCVRFKKDEGEATTQEKSETPKETQRRNELIADIIHCGHFFERRGREISLILSKESTAKFEEIGELFCVTFKRKRYKSQMQHEMKLPDFKKVS